MSTHPSAFHVYDMERPGGEPEEILLENLPNEYYRLAFLTDSGNEKLKREMEVSIAAGEIVGLLYDAFASFFERRVDHSASTKSPSRSSRQAFERCTHRRNK